MQGGERRGREGSSQWYGSLGPGWGIRYLDCVLGFFSVGDSELERGRGVLCGAR